MNKLKRLVFVIFMIIFSMFCIFILSCKKTESLTPYVIELRQDIFEGKSENYTLKASYGFTLEQDIKNYVLTIKLLDKQGENITYYAKFSYNNIEYNEKFEHNPIKNCLIAKLNIENFNEKMFTITIFNSVQNENINMASILPKNTISYQKALEYFSEQQKSTVENLTDEKGNFNADIIMRVIVKSNKAYWYIGILKDNGNLKALLIDGFDGKILAIREVL